MAVCLKCKAEKGWHNEATVEYNGTMYCTACERAWIGPRRKAAESVAGLADRLRTAIKGRGYKFKEIADYVDVSEVVLGRYVAKEGASMPGVETLAAICLALKTHPNEVLGFADPRVASLSTENEGLRKALGEIIESCRKLGWHLGDPTPSQVRARSAREFDPAGAEYRDRDEQEAQDRGY